MSEVKEVKDIKIEEVKVGKSKAALIKSAKISTDYKNRLYQVLQTPHITEKATKVADKNNQIIFRIIQDATKVEIKDAVEMIYKVKVERVQTLWAKSKMKRRGAYKGVRQGYKKAIVSVKKGQEINFAALPAQEKVNNKAE